MFTASINYTTGGRQSSTAIRVGSRVVGHVVGDVFVKHVKAAHQLRVPRGWAFDISTLDDAERAGATLVELRDEAGRVWRASIGYIRARGFTFDRGFGRQVGLCLGEWVGPGEPLPVLAPKFGEQKKPATHVQQAMF